MKRDINLPRDATLGAGETATVFDISFDGNRADASRLREVGASSCWLGAGTGFHADQARRQAAGDFQQPIGIIRTPYCSKDDCPIQPTFANLSQSQVEVFPQFATGLKDIDTFSHIFLLYSFDRAAEDIQLVRPTFLDDTPRGIFASRHPCRPNGIGLSIVRLLRTEGRLLIVEGADILNETPLLDIKPYLPQYDAFPSASEGWTANLQWRQKPEDRE